MSGFDPETLAFYAKEAPVYTASGPKGEARHLADFLERVRAGASILELGCGGGRDAEYMIAQGFLVEPTDGVPEIAAQAQARLDRPVRVMQFHELMAEAQYDAIVASASLLHVPRSGLTDIVHRIWRALKPGGWHVASFKGGGTEGRDAFGRYFNYLSRTDLEAHYMAAGSWPSMEIVEGIGGGYDGKQGPWLQIVVRKVIGGQIPVPTR